MVEDRVIVEAVKREFAALAAIPRPSGHERLVGEYVMRRLSAAGLTPEMDECGNVVVDKPATAGCEDAPLIIMQAHMDMVCLGGDDYDKYNDPIELVFDGMWMSAAGTTLGADDGIGVVEIICILTADCSHGPLRAIFTVDEESGMKGAEHLSPHYLAGRYLINVDGDDPHSIVNGNAGSLNLLLRRVPQWREPRCRSAWKIELTGLRGGHSGIDINAGRANAIKVMAELVNELLNSGACVEVAAFSGGDAVNAIPDSATAVVVVDECDRSVLEGAVDSAKRRLADLYGSIERGYDFSVGAVALPHRVLSEADAASLCNLLALAPSGVVAMTPDARVAASSNLGVAQVEHDEMRVLAMSRSDADIWLDELERAHALPAQLCGFSLAVLSRSGGWPPREGSELLAVAREVYERQLGKPADVVSVHSGLECSYFYRKNPALDMISVGPLICDIHTVKERVDLGSVAVNIKVLQLIIAAIAGRK